MSRRPPRSTRTDTRFPYTTRFRSADAPQVGPDHHVGTRTFLRGQLPAHDGDRLADDAHHALRVAAVGRGGDVHRDHEIRSEEHTSELQSLMRISYAVF